MFCVYAYVIFLRPGKRLSSLMDNMEIHDLEVSPPAARRLPPVSSPDHEPVTNDSGSDRLSVSPKDGTWPRLTSPRKKSEKNVFKFLKESDPNYTIRRQQMQMNLLLEKNQHVKQVSCLETGEQGCKGGGGGGQTCGI